MHARARDARTVLSGRTAQEVPLGHGDLDWLQVLGSLEEIAYRGWLVVERNGSTDPLGDVAAAVKFLRRCRGEFFAASWMAFRQQESKHT